MPAEDDYLVYTYNRFQACRFGLDAVYVDPATREHQPLREHILRTMDQIDVHSVSLGAQSGIDLLRRSAAGAHNEARWLRECHAQENLLAEVTRQAAARFRR
jgi:carboxylate-amine ligase